MGAAPRPAGAATLLIVGDELLAGEVNDANGPFLARELGELGFGVREIRVLPDDVSVISSALHQACAVSDLVVVCGGLGPTSDDRTTEAVAAALGLELAEHAPSWRRVEALFAARGFGPPPPSNRKQALLPTGASVLTNSWGTAPGYCVAAGAALVAVLPGPPRENQPLYSEVLEPLLRDRQGAIGAWTTRIVRAFGLGESSVAQTLSGVEPQLAEQVRVGYQASFPEVLVKLRGPTENLDALDAATATVTTLLGRHAYGEGTRRLPAVLGAALARRGRLVTTAESCTGGLVAALLTEEPGSSAWMDRAFVVYTNRAKQELLGVPEELLRAHGAVSEPVVAAMLDGALRRSAATVGVAISGVAGPGGGTETKPVGTVCLAWGDADTPCTTTLRLRWDRERNRVVAAWAALARLLSWVQAEGTAQ